jgi:transcriptional regulator of acetoin/glycerol metabolism
MIKNIQQFPLLDTHQFILNAQTIIRMCNDGITEMEDHLECLRLELDNTPLEYEQNQIIEDIVACNLHMAVCEMSKSTIYSQLKQFSYILN